MCHYLSFPLCSNSSKSQHLSNGLLSSLSIPPAGDVAIPLYHQKYRISNVPHISTDYILTSTSRTSSAPSSGGIADDSIGGTYNSSANNPSNTQPFSGSSNANSESYGTQSAGYDNNVERTGPEESGSKGGVKGVLGKIKDKLAPSGQGQSTKVDEV